jgi:hypothetical protein
MATQDALPATEVIEALAGAAHEVFCDGLRAQGFRYGPDSLARLKTHSQLTPFSELSPWERDEYRERLRHVPDLFTAANYFFVRAGSAGGDSGNANIDVERLASTEHERWLRKKLDAGWRYAPRGGTPGHRDDSSMIPWRALSPAERARLPPADAAALGPGELPAKKKDVCRDLVRGFIDLIPRAGLVVVRGPGPASTDTAVGDGRAAHAFGGKADVFISARSVDYDHAQAVYDFLIGHHVAAFFSRESLPELGISDYRKQIDQALDETRHMIVVTSSVENVNSSWVEAEWGFFISEKRSGRKGGNLVTLVVGGLPPAALPPSLRYYEVIPFADFERVLGYVKPAART